MNERVSDGETKPVRNNRSKCFIRFQEHLKININANHLGKASGICPCHRFETFIENPAGTRFRGLRSLMNY